MSNAHYPSPITMKFSVIIPARYASTRFPGKPLADVGGKPMVVRVAERARRSGAGEVLIATDDRRIAAAASRHGFDAVMTQARHPTGTDRIAEVATRRRYRATHIIVNAQGDEPLIAPSLVRAVAADLARHPAASIATACCPIRNARELGNPNVVKVVLDCEGYALYFSRAPVPYARDAFARGLSRIPAGLPVFRHIGIYAYRASFLKRYARLTPTAIERFEALEQLRALAHGHRIHCTVTRAAPHPGVDTPADLKQILRLPAHRPSRRT
jgi:3-deoxy-manno-octulosonate cytidylyltransferase (CMP-KDO synthetase)